MHGKENPGAESYGEYIYSVGRITGTAAEALKVSKSYSNFGATISPRDFKCRFHIASMKAVRDIHPGQALSVHKLKCAFRTQSSTGRSMLKNLFWFKKCLNHPALVLAVYFGWWAVCAALAVIFLLVSPG